MCGICGAVARDGKSSVIGIVLDMMDTMSHRGPDSSGIAWDGGWIHDSTPAAVRARIANVSAARAIGHERLQITGGTRGRQPFCSDDGALKLVFNGEIYNYRDIQDRMASGGTDTDGEVLFQSLEESFDGDAWRAVRHAYAELDGDYAFAVMDRGQIVLARDRVGIKQVYIGQNDNIVAFASERKALWGVGLRTSRLDPGHVLRITEHGVVQEPIHEFSAPPISIRDHSTAIKEYGDRFLAAVAKRVNGQRRVGVLFSGGVDSVMVARVASSMCDEVIGYTGSVPGAPDLRSAIAAAGLMKLPLRVSELTGPRIESLLPEVIGAIEDRDLLQVEVAMPMYAALKLAREDGIRVVLTGQGADEISAGYEWYPGILRERGEDALLESMWSDLANLYRDTLEREDKMSMAHSIEMRVPFLDPGLIDVAMRISPLLKVRTEKSRERSLRKRLHRELALKLGVPGSIVFRPKEGAQHGSGIHSALEEMARRRLSPLNAPAILDLDNSEIRGSAFRHGGIDVHASTYGTREAQAYVDEVAEAVLGPLVAGLRAS